ncbi:unnamed protein product [Adineta ricciae]|uniref:Uncharacterized protein n=1 Tax=Adineta ricciae TaxID=249248 RepID=A0A814BDK1_ADIRI|nr:unnamed protein product [Adineta ricciae]
MLKVDYLHRESFVSQPIVTAAQAKQHLHEIRLQRQNQLRTTINECHRLQNIHKQIYNHAPQQWNSHSTEKHVNHQGRTVSSPKRLPKYSIPRIEYASLIYRPSKSTFEIDAVDKPLPIIKELTDHLSKSPCAIFSNDRQEINRSLSAIKHDRQRCLSVSSISSLDKRTHKVYEKWPDYNQISEIVGYRIDPPAPKVITSNITPSRPSKTRSQQKRNSSTKLSITPKPKQPSGRKSQKDTLIPIVVEEPSLILEVPSVKATEEIKPNLPDLLCPSSIVYSQRVRTRQWLMKHNFSCNPIQTLPLL